MSESNPSSNSLEIHIACLYDDKLYPNLKSKIDTTEIVNEPIIVDSCRAIYREHPFMDKLIGAQLNFKDATGKEVISNISDFALSELLKDEGFIEVQKQCDSGVTFKIGLCELSTFLEAEAKNDPKQQLHEKIKAMEAARKAKL